MGRAEQILGGLIRGRRLDLPVVIDLGEAGWPARRGVRDRITWVACRLAKPVVVVGSAAQRHRLGSIPTALIPSGAEVGPAARRDGLERLHRRLRAPGGPRFIAVNGRYRARPTTGVERVATGVVDHGLGPLAVFAPSPRLARGLPGHLWEQLVLPVRVRAARARLWSPCNFGPLLVRDQILTIHDLAPLDRPEWFAPGYRRWIKGQWWLQYRRVRTITVVSRFTRDRLVAWWGERDRLVVVPNGVDQLDRRGPDAGSTSGEADGPGGPTVCVVGSLEPRKNLATLVAAMGQVRRSHGDARLVVIGDVGDPRVFASTLGADLSAGWIDVRGRLDDEELRRTVQVSSCLAYVSCYEGFGLPPLEAMAAGTPVVASDLPAIREVCGDVAVLVDPADPAAVAAGIGQVLALSPAARSEVVAAGRRRAAGFDWCRAAESLEGLVWP